MLGISTNTNVKLPILRLGFYLDVKVNCKFAIIFHTPQNLRHLEIASGFITGTHTGTKHSKIKTEKEKKLTAVTRKCAPISDHADWPLI